MGTPEFPDLGKHCFVEDCKQIDFLPFTCDRCIQVFCLNHRSYLKHQCPKGDKNDVTVVICPLCAKGVRLNPDEDPNITWETHANTNCDPSNYINATKKKKCPVPGCRDILVFSNTIKCRDCSIDHCLKHRFGTDHQCPGPRNPSNKNQKENMNRNSSSKWATGFLNMASSFKSKAEKGISKWGGQSSNYSGNQGEFCPQCDKKFSSVEALVEHVEKVHEKARDHRVLDVCPRCSKGFLDPVSLVEHVESEHRGTSKA